MEQLIIVNEDKQTVSARDLHEKLEIATAYKDWFPRMCEYGFEENKDFKLLNIERVQVEGLRTVKRAVSDAEISIDMAKQICMIQRTPIGKRIRDYFLDLEKAWNTPEQIMARALKVAQYTIDSLHFQIEEMQPKVDYFDELVDRKLNTSFRDTAKELKVKEKFFIDWLLTNKYIYRDSQTSKLCPYAKYTESGKGYFTMKDTKSKFNNWTGVQTFITPIGKETFRLLLSHGVDDE